MKKVLVVEDYPSLQQIYKISLTSAGYSVDTASDGDEAISLLKKNKYDCLLLDLLLQRVSGLEVLRGIDAPQNYPQMKIIVFSNLSSPDVAAEAKKLGVSHYFIKSDYTPKEIVNVIDHEVGGKS